MSYLAQYCPAIFAMARVRMQRREKVRGMQICLWAYRCSNFPTVYFRPPQASLTLSE